MKDRAAWMGVHAALSILLKINNLVKNIKVWSKRKLTEIIQQNWAKSQILPGNVEIGNKGDYNENYK